MTVLSKLRSALKLMALLLGVVAIWELWAPIAYFAAPALGLSDSPLRAEGRVVSSVSAVMNRDDLPREQRLRGGYLGNDILVRFTDRNGDARTASGRTLFFSPRLDDAVDVYYFESELADVAAGDAAPPREARALIDLPGLLYGRAALFGAMGLILLILYRAFGYFGRRMAATGALANTATATLRAASGQADREPTARVIEDAGSDSAALRAAVTEVLHQTPAALIAKLAALACFFIAGLWALGAVLSLWQMFDPSLDFSGSFLGSAVACVIFATAGWYLRKLAARLPGGRDRVGRS